MPTRTFASRSCLARPANRASSRAAVPSDVTSTAASKLSCAMSATSARSCWARMAAGDIRRWNTRFATTASGRTTSAASASQTSVRNSATVATTSMTATPSANGRGLKMPVAASTSALALDSSCPVGCWRCQLIGRCRYWRVTPERWSSWISAKPRPAKMRRSATVTASETATRAMAAPASQIRPWASSEPAIAGTTTSSVIVPSTRLTPTVEHTEHRRRAHGRDVGARVRAHAPPDEPRGATGHRSGERRRSRWLGLRGHDSTFHAADRGLPRSFSRAGRRAGPRTTRARLDASGWSALSA